MIPRPYGAFFFREIGESGGNLTELIDVLPINVDCSKKPLNFVIFRFRILQNCLHIVILGSILPLQIV